MISYDDEYAADDDDDDDDDDVDDDDVDDFLLLRCIAEFMLKTHLCFSSCRTLCCQDQSQRTSVMTSLCPMRNARHCQTPSSHQTIGRRDVLRHDKR